MGGGGDISETEKPSIRLAYRGERGTRTLGNLWIFTELIIRCSGPVKIQQEVNQWAAVVLSPAPGTMAQQGLLLLLLLLHWWTRETFSSLTRACLLLDDDGGGSGVGVFSLCSSSFSCWPQTQLDSFRMKNVFVPETVREMKMMGSLGVVYIVVRKGSLNKFYFF